MSPISKPAREVAVGRVFLLREARLLLRRVEPKSGIGLLGLPVSNDYVLAVDDEGGLYAIHPDEAVEVPFSVPLVTQVSEGHYIVVATFERQVSDDLPVLEGNYRRGLIDADPHKDFPLAVMQQLTLELRPGYEQGMGGYFQCHRVIEGHAFDLEAMGWPKKPARKLTGLDSDPTRNGS